jgi:phage terminase large subunit-like protein
VLALAFRWSADGELAMRLLVWSEVKKSGKTFIAAVLGLWWAFVTASTEVIVAANDLEQSVGRVFTTMADLCRVNPALAASVTVRAEAILVSNGTTITAIASDYRGAAGSRHSLAIFDELWGFSSENAQRLYEELTVPPTERNAWLLIVTTAGFTNESKLLETIYRRGLSGERIDDGLEVYQADDLVMFWSHTRRQAWQLGARGERYYAEQGRSLRPSTFARLHRNEWVAAESVFLTPELWDGCVAEGLHPLMPTRAVRVFAGIDASTKRDSSAVMAVYYLPDGRLALAGGRIWQPTAATPLDLEQTIESYVRLLHERYALEAVLADPYQLHRSIMTLQAAGIPIREYPQTTAGTTLMASTLFDLLSGKNLVLYPSSELRAQALATAAAETPGGFRIAKDKASKKIDAIVALAMACVAAVEGKPAADAAIVAAHFGQALADSGDDDADVSLTTPSWRGWKRTP